MPSWCVSVVRYAEDWGAVEGTMVHAALTEGRVLYATA
jgi:hypothetical protein